jgi:class 3 adenylate cyclase
MLNRDDLLALVESAKELSSELDLSALLEKILVRAGSMTGSSSGSVILLDEERNGLFFAAATGPKAQEVLKRFGEDAPDRVPIEGSKAGYVYLSGESLVQESVQADPEHFKGVDRSLNHRTESMICVPLQTADYRLGVVQLLNKNSGNYDARDVALLEHFASHAAVAIRNARHFRDLLAHKGLFASADKGKKIQDLLRELSAPAHVERITVMFADMRGFTRLAQVLGDPKEIEQHLNEFLTVLSTNVARYNGLVNKFLGDGVLALFREVDHETRAVRCAFAIVNGFHELRDRWNGNRAESLDFLDVGVGIATGNVTIGAIGSGRVKDFTALGNPVNLAAAFQEQARGGLRVLVDQVTFNAVKLIVADMDDKSVDYELRKPDQPSGIVYKRIHLRRLRPEPGSEIVITPPTHSPASLRSYYNDSWAIVVGVDNYKSNRIGRLSYAVADALAVAEGLPKAGFPADHIEVLYNEKASREAIHKAIYGKLSSTHHDDRLLVFFALHGQVLKQHKGEEGYLLPYDTDPANLPLTALPMSELSQIGQRLPPKHILFVLDTCFSGYAAKRDSATPGGSLDLSLLTQEPVVQLLTAGTSGEKVIEEGGHGIFTRTFLKGLEGWADPARTGLTALKLGLYIQERVIAASGKRQTPQCAKLQGEGEFLFLPPGQ